MAARRYRTRPLIASIARSSAERPFIGFLSPRVELLASVVAGERLFSKRGRYDDAAVRALF